MTPTFGVKWETALSNGFTINKDGEILVVEPYFFSPKNINASELTFDWSLNREKYQPQVQKHIIH